MLDLPLDPQNPENIRLLMVDALPLPLDPDLQAAALQAGLLGAAMTGLTLRGLASLELQTGQPIRLDDFSS